MALDAVTLLSELSFRSVTLTNTRIQAGPNFGPWDSNCEGFQFASRYFAVEYRSFGPDSFLPDAWEYHLKFRMHLVLLAEPYGSLEEDVALFSDWMVRYYVPDELPDDAIWPLFEQLAFPTLLPRWRDWVFHTTAYLGFEPGVRLDAHPVPLEDSYDSDLGLSPATAWMNPDLQLQRLPWPLPK